MSEFNRGFNPDEFKNTVHEKAELRGDIAPIKVELIDLSSGSEELEAYRDSREELNKGVTTWVDFDGFDPEKYRAEGFKDGGIESYLISPVAERDWFSDHYINCTAVVGVGRDTKSGKEISFLSHQDPRYFVRGDDEQKGKFSQDLAETLKELKVRSEEGTVEVSLLGGSYNPSLIKHEEYRHDDYKKSIEILREIVHQSLGFDPRVLAGPDSVGPETVIDVETQKRKVWVERQKQAAEFEEAYQANQLDEMEKKWIEKSPISEPVVVIEKTKPKKRDNENLFPAKKLQPFEERRESSREVTELQKMFDEFEAKHSLEELYAITDLDAKDAPDHPVRQPAKNDLLLIFNKLSILEDETRLDSEIRAELKARYKNLANAVGYINHGKLTHSR